MASGPISLRTQLRTSAYSSGRRLFTVIERDVSVNRLTFDVMRNTDHGRFGDFRMRYQRRFDLCSSQTMARYVQHVIHAAGDQK